jgi:hypothetical protein
VIIVSVLKGDNGDNAPLDEDSTYIPETMIYDDVISEPIYDGMPDGVSYRKVSTRTVTDVKTASRLVMNYPVFSGFPGDGADAEINSLIVYHNDLMKKDFGNGMDKMLGHNIKVIYEINDFVITYIDSDFMSIVYDGVFSTFSEYDHIDTGNYYFKYSINADIKNRKAISGEEIISNFSLIKSHLIAGDMNIEHAIDGLLEYFTYYEMTKQYSDVYKVYPMLYFTKDKINLIISLTPDLGGHAVFSYNVQESREFINFDLQCLRGLLSE